MKLRELLKGVEVVQIIGNEQVEITNITQDSRKIIQNTLFFAIKGVKTYRPIKKTLFAISQGK